MLRAEFEIISISKIDIKKLLSNESSRNLISKDFDLFFIQEVIHEFGSHN